MREDNTTRACALVQAKSTPRIGIVADGWSVPSAAVPKELELASQGTANPA